MKKQIENIDIEDLKIIFLNRIKSIDPDKKAELALSGGTDSLTVLFTMLAAGQKPHCITFTLDNYKSVDLKSSIFICKELGLKHTVVEVKTKKEDIIEDVRFVISKCHIIKKTVIQCMIPWIYIYPAMKQNLIITGMGGDDLFCNQRKVMVDLHNKGEEYVKKYRKVYSNDPLFSGWNISKLGDFYGKKNIDFYDDVNIINWFLRFNVKALNKPFEKYPSIEAYISYYKEYAIRRKHSSYQINSKLKDLHEKILLSPEINKIGAKDVIKIYNWIAKGMGK